MKKIVLTLTLLLSYTSHNNAQVKPSKIETDILRLVDGIIIQWDAIGLIKQYLNDVETFLRKKYYIDNRVYNLISLVHLEDKESLSSNTKKFLPRLVSDFLKFSAHFLETLRPVKSGLLEVIDTACAMRNRTDCLLLKWAHVNDNDEQELFAREITSYRALCTFCIDLKWFLNDLIYSCPKASKQYENITKRFHTIRTHVDEFLNKENKKLNPKQYKTLLSLINKKYTTKVVTKNTTQNIYRSCIRNFV